VFLSDAITPIDDASGAPMTSDDVAQAVLRRWWVLLIALGVTVLLMRALAPAPPVYWARYDLNLVAPDRSGEVYSRISAPPSVTALAGVLEVLLGGNDMGPQAATQTVPIFGLHNRTGVQVLAKDRGFQWSRDYVAALAVQIAAPTADEVDRQAAALLDRARATLATVQDQYGVPRASQVTLEEPSAIEIVRVYPAGTRAMVGLALLGVGLSLILTVTVDRLLLRRRRGSDVREASGQLAAADPHR
jgi:hypothetical protein